MHEKAPKRPISPAAQKVIDAVRSEMATPEGRAKLMKALELAQQASDRFREAAKVDPLSLLYPMDI